MTEEDFGARFSKSQPASETLPWIETPTQRDMYAVLAQLHPVCEFRGRAGVGNFLG